MSCLLKAGFSISGSSDILVNHRGKGGFTISPSIGPLQFRVPDSKEFSGKTLDSSDQKGFWNSTIKKSPKLEPIYALTSVSFGKAQKWWEKNLQPNMVEINSGQELVSHLLNGGDKLVILDFYSPGCGGCRSLHPKICQLAELNPNAIFLTVNYGVHKEMCYALNVHVLPFFRFYRGANGRVCSFSCTNATIKKFRDALAKYSKDRVSPGPAKGLSEEELMALAKIGQIPEEYVLHKEGELVFTQGKEGNKLGLKEGDNALVMV